ncbi:glycosyltransferase [Cohnella caldifontis]|uniref:glycosyltransferase n=1 Tax=Cohnella caldifontis TaxID=3027471 RepID=UPI0023EDCBEC|nr:glycosyltransferase [Cohnella sp. YIM B05605]
MDNPVVSVIMPVFNGEKFLKEAIDSILSQTFTDFELIIIDDGSTDHSRDIVLAYEDVRIRYERNDQNRRIVYTLNKGLNLARGMYVARMDADDICLPERLEKQVHFLDCNSEIGLVGSWIEVIGRTTGIVRYPLEHNEIVSHLFFYNCFAHPSVMFRRELFLANNLLYSNQLIEAEDYELWVRSSKHLRMANLGEPYLRYRMHDEQGTIINQERVSNFTDYTRQVQLRTLGIALNNETSKLHRLVCNGIYQCYYHPDAVFTEKDEQQIEWVDILMERNEALRIIPKETFNQLIMPFRRIIATNIQVMKTIKEISASRPIFLWGTGGEGLEVFRLIEEERVEVSGFIDNDHRKWNSVVNGKPVVGPNVVHSIQSPFIIICSMFRNDISEQLISEGFIEGTDFMKKMLLSPGETSSPEWVISKAKEG